MRAVCDTSARRIRVMGFSSVAAACFILFACISQMRASVLPAVDAGLRGKTDKFTLRITEQQANFEEQVAIDEDNDIEYFSVPAHNDVNAADFLFDFKMVRFSFFVCFNKLRYRNSRKLKFGRTSEK
ncbi:hypothetical protein OS493_014566 [Desmophyllum pertusum]|uniref:Uncharacterized protein n=1 Tax=Desmophyllum pertusum TaxID=174260 RepID=A0A9W9YR89_9CNID|nr:hypothetical protein OS493_014566 [Desmophyllum pertusum]